MSTESASATAADAGSTPIVEMRGIEKSFGRVDALDGVDLEVRDNEIMGLVGDNGAGKSTLIKTLVGVLEADAGEVYVDGDVVDISSPREAREHGITTVYQDLALVDELSVAANTFLGRPLTKQLGPFSVTDWDRMEEEAGQLLRENLNIQIDPSTPVEYLSGGERQAVAINRALVTDPRLIIMDEPTSALSADSAERVMDLVKTLRDRGLTVLLISHNLDEVFSLTDRITVVANGRNVATVDTDTVEKEQVVQMMISEEIPDGVDEGVVAQD